MNKESVNNTHNEQFIRNCWAAVVVIIVIIVVIVVFVYSSSFNECAHESVSKGGDREDNRVHTISHYVRKFFNYILLNKLNFDCDTRTHQKNEERRGANRDRKKENKLKTQQRLQVKKGKKGVNDVFRMYWMVWVYFS